MATKRMLRRHFLKGAASTAAIASLTPGLRLPAAAQSAATRPADLVLRNGKIITIDGPSTLAQAVAIAGDRIIAVGPDASMSAHTTPATRVRDLNGRAVIPGLNDGHAHMDREALRHVFPVTWARPFDQGHPGAHRRARSRQASRVNGSSPCRSAIRPIISMCPTPGGKALADPPGARRCRAQQSGLHPRDMGILARHVADRILRQHRGAQACWHHPRHRLARRRRSRSKRMQTAIRPASSSNRRCSRSRR